MGATKGTGKLRIIAGEWRGRKLPVADIPGLRPSTDRIRETVFNWLAPEIAGARCLDLFAGTGALGLEALSRGAMDCQFVECHPQAATLLKQALLTLNATPRGKVHHQDATQYLGNSEASGFDLLFLDPPFASDLLDQVLAQLCDYPYLNPKALVYVEYAPSQSPQFPRNWEQYRSKSSGGVVYELYRLPGR
ncbi:16S rRNA (guanine(966)-N(2))-methyltransferase RsmD [Congregibacter sp.]|uniref:16S rRNA (guanine(966)-N(2))-methyltransferase RsmD n=1 Tax=Congregibacter sp. TaxID=2744308 RepID=UPI003F6D494D